MKWINAAESNYMLEEELFIKDDVGCKRKGNFFEDNGDIRLYIQGTSLYDSYEVQEHHFNHYFWLDEDEPVLSDNEIDTLALKPAIEHWHKFPQSNTYDFRCGFIAGYKVAVDK